VQCIELKVVWFELIEYQVVCVCNYTGIATEQCTSTIFTWLDAAATITLASEISAATIQT